MATSPVVVGIAVVEHDGNFLIGRRGPDGPLPGFDEFPGGKCNADESPEACAVRECFEETGVTVHAESLLLERAFSYSHADVELHFWHCRLIDERRRLHVRAPFRWVPREQLGELSFPEANAPLLALLETGRLRNDSAS